MPIHDWSRVETGIFHHFRQSWIGDIARTLNNGVLPHDYYALKEQFAGGRGPDVLTLQGTENGDEHRPSDRPSVHGGAVALAAPQLRPVAETDLAFYRRKQNIVSVRHVSDDRVVAILEIVSPGNKAAQHPFQAVRKAADFIEAGIHLLVIDIHRPTRRDPQGIHAAIWNAIPGEEHTLPAKTALTLAAYECGNTVRALRVTPRGWRPVARDAAVSGAGPGSLRAARIDVRQCIRGSAATLATSVIRLMGAGNA